MGLSIELLVGLGTVKAEVGAEVDDLEAFFQKSDRVAGGLAMGEGKKGDFRTTGRDRFHVGIEKGEVASGNSGEAREDGGNWRAYITARGGSNEVGLRVNEKKAKEFTSRVPTRSQNGDLDLLHG